MNTTNFSSVLNNYAERSQQVREIEQTSPSAERGVRAKVNALLSKAGRIATSMSAPVAYTALGLAGIAATAFLVNQSGVFSSRSSTHYTAAPSVSSIAKELSKEEKIALGNQWLNHIGFDPEKGVNCSIYDVNGNITLNSNLNSTGNQILSQVTALVQQGEAAGQCVPPEHLAFVIGDSASKSVVKKQPDRSLMDLASDFASTFVWMSDGRMRWSAPVPGLIGVATAVKLLGASHPVLATALTIGSFAIPALVDKFAGYKIEDGIAQIIEDYRPDRALANLTSAALWMSDGRMRWSAPVQGLIGGAAALKFLGVGHPVLATALTIGSFAVPALVDKFAGVKIEDGIAQIIEEYRPDRALANLTSTALWMSDGRVRWSAPVQGLIGGAAALKFLGVGHPVLATALTIGSFAVPALVDKFAGVKIEDGIAQIIEEYRPANLTTKALWMSDGRMRWSAPVLGLLGGKVAITLLGASHPILATALTIGSFATPALVDQFTGLKVEDGIVKIIKDYQLDLALTNLTSTALWMSDGRFRWSTPVLGLMGGKVALKLLGAGHPVLATTLAISSIATPTLVDQFTGVKIEDRIPQNIQNFLFRAVT